MAECRRVLRLDQSEGIVVALSGKRRPDAPSLFSALPQQLGLKLELRRQTVPVLVIERLEPPTEN